MPHETYSITSLKPVRRWTRPYSVTLSDTVSDKNLQINGTPFRYLQNVGTSGAVMIAWEPDTTVQIAIYLAQGQVIEGGLFAHAKSTGTGAGVSIIGFVGREDVGS